MENEHSRSDLDVIEHRFLQLAAQPNALTLDGAVLGCGIPPQPQPLDLLRNLLLKPRTTWLTKEAVWRELVRRAHMEPEPWMTATAGMMCPGLKGIARKLSPRYPHNNKIDLHSEILVGFFEALDLAEPDQPRVYSQLYWGAFRRGHELCNRENRNLQRIARYEEVDELGDGHWRRSTAGNADLLLAGAVLNNVLTKDEAALVSEICLDGEEPGAAASRRGLSKRACDKRLAQAERKLVGFLNSRIPDLAA
ncbi:hypothetical protein [Allokutzneria albata]|uniref:DNA-directed RNA polymerase specialized sigma subunit, sigma24 family n=1 Tax=Allokutzneria albata TaxID=211114 RepID=A0A1G9WDH9_ALLAB|nr:hypothetical protein [Allokutzneria albata]SDM82549.1 hypothetical protein SAMN04489726_3546 [Allokutzneria albata]